MSISNIDSLELGKFLQIVFSDGLRNQISADYRDWEYITRLRYGNTAAREYRFLFQTAYGASAIQYRNPGVSNREFPAAQQLTSSEHTALFKEINATIELEYNLWDRARKSPEKYAEPLAAEIQAKTTASKRRIAADLYGDGTGVIGQVAAAAGVLVGSNVQLALDTAGRGHVGFFEFGDILEARELDGTASTLAVTGGTLAFLKVVSKDRENNTVILEPLDSSLNPIVATGVTPTTAAEVLYRFGQPTKNIDLTGAIADYGTVSEVMAGLESLAANDGRVIHGITMSGATAGTRIDAGGNPLDVKFIQKALDAGKIAVGADAYKWAMMCMAPESQATLIESRETDRRFQTIEDNKRGIKYFGYVHGNDVLETYTTEYVPQNRIWMLPEQKSNGGKVLEYVGSDFETVKGPNMSDFHLKATSAGYVNSVQSFLQGIMVLVAKHPAALISVGNFTNS